MANPFSDVDIKRFRLHAKHLSRSKSISHSEALDAVAQEQGFSNWALLMKSASPRRTVYLSSLKSTPRRSPEQIREAIVLGRFAELKPDQV